MPPPALPSAKRILLAEDTDALSDLMKQLLEEAGYEVAQARDGEDCLARVASFQPDLLILDLMMPRLHGVEVLRRLREQPATRPLGVIVCTARAFKTDFAAAAELGAYAFLRKPHGNTQLLEAVAAFFADRKSTRLNSSQ